MSDIWACLSIFWILSAFLMSKTLTTSQKVCIIMSHVSWFYYQHDEEWGRERGKEGVKKKKKQLLLA